MLPPLILRCRSTHARNQAGTASEACSFTSIPPPVQGLLLVWFVVRVDWKESAITARQNFHLRTLRRMRNFRSMRSATGGSGGPGGSRRRRGQIEYDIPEELLVPEYEQKAEAAAAAAAEAVNSHANGHANGHAAEEGGGDDKVGGVGSACRAVRQVVLAGWLGCNVTAADTRSFLHQEGRGEGWAGTRASVVVVGCSTIAGAGRRWLHPHRCAIPTPQR